MPKRDVRPILRKSECLAKARTPKPIKVVNEARNMASFTVSMAAMAFIRVALIKAGIVNGVINPHAHNDNPQHNTGDIQRMADNLQCAQCCQERKGDRRKHRKRDEPIQIIYKNDQYSTDGSDERNFHKDIF